MKLSSTKGTINTKGKIIGLIKEFFDTKFISETARSTKFVQRKSKLEAYFFFSVCLRPGKKERRVWMIYVGSYKRMGLKSENKACRGGSINRERYSCERW